MYSSFIDFKREFLYLAFEKPMTRRQLTKVEEGSVVCDVKISRPISLCFRSAGILINILRSPTWEVGIGNSSCIENGIWGAIQHHAVHSRLISLTIS